MEDKIECCICDVEIPKNEVVYRYGTPFCQYCNSNITDTIRGDKKVGRNELCHCGSGKKYKRCCGKTTMPSVDL